MSLGGNSGSSKSSSESSKFGMNIAGSQSYLDAQQQGNQQGLVNRFMGAMDNGLGQIQGFGQQAQQFGQGIANTAQGMSPFLQGLSQSAQYGQQALQGFAQNNNPYLQSAIGQYGQDINQQLQRQMPGIGANAQMAGQRGGDRQMIQQGLAQEAAINQFGRGASDMRMQAYGQQQNAAGALAGLGQQFNQGAGIQGGMYGQGMTGLAQVGQQQLAQQMMPFQIGTGVIGAPTALSQSFGYGTETAQSTSKGKSSSAGLNMGFI